MKRLIVILIAGLWGQALVSQTRSITLSEAFEIAEEQSLDALNARNVFLYTYWQYRNYKAELLPNVVEDITLSISQIS